MANRIYLDLSVSNANVIMVDGVCYERVGPSRKPPNAFSIDDEFELCEDCQSSSSESAESWFRSCQQTPTSSSEVTGGSRLFCEDGNGTYSSNKTYAETDDCYEWSWQKSIYTPDYTTHCDEYSGEVAARIDNSYTDAEWGGDDSIWTGFKVVTGSVSCSNGNLAGTFELDTLEPAFCSGQTVEVTQ